MGTPMEQLNLSLSHSIQACRQLTRLACSNFTPAFALLPSAKRQAMEILYAYTRFTDDLVDLPDYSEGGNSIEITSRRRRQKLNQWVNALEAVFGKIGDGNPPQIDPEDVQTFQRIAQKFPNCAGLVFLPALKMIVNKYNIPCEPLFHLVEGVEADIESKPFETFEDSLEYCHRVATSVGVASLAIWGTTEPLFSESVVKAAKACGVAFQWTNIVRDMLEDYRYGRIYLPISELHRFGFTNTQFGSILDKAEWNAQKKPPKMEMANEFYVHQNKVKEMEEMEDKFLKLMNHQLHRCEVYYENSLPLYHLIQRDCRRAFGLMWNYYHALYQKINSNPWLVARNERVQLPPYRKLSLWFRWHCLPCRQLQNR